MTPPARIQAAIEIIDIIRDGTSVEMALTNWARRHRFAGSKDRAAIRDHVFGALRCWRSCAAWGGGESGRQIMAGAIRMSSGDPADVFSGEKYAPPRLAEGEADGAPPVPGTAAALDCPDHLLPLFDRALGETRDAVLMRLRERAPVHLRVNLKHTSVADVAAELQQSDIHVRPHPLAATALEVVEGKRRLKSSAAYLEGRVELQDAASQAAAEIIPIRSSARVLDYCAGGGGKTLALAARVDARFFAHDINVSRMRDLPGRARRAGINVELLDPAKMMHAGAFDTVVCDAPCSGSGAWRRAPQGKWTLTPERLDSLMKAQDQVLQSACKFVISGGHLAYLTCSMFEEENGDRIASFLKLETSWRLERELRLTPLDGGDGFYAAILKKTDVALEDVD